MTKNCLTLLKTGIIGVLKASDAATVTCVTRGNCGCCQKMMKLKKLIFSSIKQGGQNVEKASGFVSGSRMDILNVSQ
jgi:hypothetical protein